MILFFEYALASGFEDKNILKEGKMMFDTLLKQFLEIDKVISLLYKDFVDNYIDFKNLEIVKIKKENEIENKLKSLLKSENIDYALVVAPEDEDILYNLTKIIESYPVKNLGCSSEAIKIAGNKYLTYLAIKDAVKTPKTFPPKKYVVKKIDSCGGKFNLFDENFLIQEFIDGENLSVSLIVGKKIHPLSLNRQYIDKRGFVGGEVNINHKLKDKIFNEAIKAVKCINGLNGYVGVDVIVNNDGIYIIEINPRITTTIYGLKTNPSLAELLIKNANNEELKFKVKGEKFTIDK
ncbi:TPA: ATP-grasp domain-containing protein [Methanocaldococcus jannaschii]|uniref:ATP-grasp domain-containing protein n=1 Tax=Methanocaldococcus jannaschii TaxID=2190 RepID=A0A832T407_9EURY|nr:tyramine--L-glutamate ligase [Methanocaldococcus jannaschii]HII59701.1 ATP-grasp domain-containing protein [Methanocaldococcus jannaschii]